MRHEFNAQVLADGGAGAVPVRRAVPPADLGVGAGRPPRRPAGRHRPPLARPTATAAPRGGHRQSRRSQTGRRGGQCAPPPPPPPREIDLFLSLHNNHTQCVSRSFTLRSV